MNRDDIIRMAQESGMAEVLSNYNGEYGHDNSKETAGFLELVRFAALVAAHEREECAKLCDELRDSFLSPQYATGQPMSSIGERFAAGRCAEVIRARSEA